ncbi:MAG: 3-oxoacyl-ACP reductase family protein [Planctomycetota bacterium]
MELQGKVALVSGASRGIGRAIALELAQAKCDIIVNFVNNRTAADEVVAIIRGMGCRAACYQADVSVRAQTDAMIDAAQTEIGKVDILVNNAGITRDSSFMKLSAEKWREVLLVNLDGPFNLTSRLLPNMVEARWGRIINITSIVAQMGNFGQSNYAVAKGGLIALTRALAREVAHKGVTVNAIAPGFIETDMTSVVSEKVLQSVCDLTPVGRLGKPEEVAIAARFLAHPMSSFVTGQVINVNGGMYML